MPQGARILDLGWVLAGPFAGQLLAQLGADVIKVEPLEGDMARTIPPHLVDGKSSFFLAVNRGKRSITINIKHERGAAARRCAAATKSPIRPGASMRRRRASAQRPSNELPAGAERPDGEGSWGACG